MPKVLRNSPLIGDGPKRRKQFSCEGCRRRKSESDGYELPYRTADPASNLPTAKCDHKRICSGCSMRNEACVYKTPHDEYTDVTAEALEPYEALRSVALRLAQQLGLCEAELDSLVQCAKHQHEQSSSDQSSLSPQSTTSALSAEDYAPSLIPLTAADSLSTIDHHFSTSHSHQIPNIKQESIPNNFDFAFQLNTYAPYPDQLLQYPIVNLAPCQSLLNPMMM